MQVTWTQLVNLWFDLNRGLALAIILSGTGLAGIGSATLAELGDRAMGLASRLLDTGSAAAAGYLAAVAVLAILGGALGQTRGRGRRVRCRRCEIAGMTLRQVARSRRFWVCNIALLLAVTAMIGMVINTVPLLRDKGLSAKDAAAVFSIYGVSLVLGRVVVGYLIDRFWAPGVAFIVMLAPAFGSLIFMTQGDMQMLMLGSILVGLGAGAEMDIAAFLMARYFGMRDYARVYSLHMGIISLGSTLAPFGYAILFARTGSYNAMLIYCTLAFAVCSALLLTLGRYRVSKARQ